MTASSASLSVRGVARELGISRWRATALVYSGVLRAQVAARGFIIPRAEIERAVREHPELFASPDA